MPVVFLVGYVVLLLWVPSQLIFRPLGAPGTPANLWAVAGLVWWVCVNAGGLSRVRGLTATRVALALLGVAVLLAYANGMASGWYAPPTTRQKSDEFWTLVTPTVQQVSDALITSADRSLLSVAGWCGVVLVAAEGLRSWAELDRVLTWLTMAASVVAGLGVVQFFTGIDVARYITIPGLSPNSELSGVIVRSDLNRVTATAVHPIELGVVLACVFPLVLHRSLHRWGRRGAAVPLALVFAAAFMTVSRSAMLGLVVAGLVLFVGWPRSWRLRALVVVPVAVVAMRVMVPGLVGTLVSLFRNVGNDPSVSGRTEDYAIVLGLYADHPWLGRGLGTFLPRYFRILDNQWLGVLVELGLVGLLAVLVLYGAAYLSARSAFRSAADPRSRHLGLALSAAIAADAVSMTTFDAWGFPMAAGLGFLLIGLAGAARRLTVLDRSHPPVKEPARVAARG